MIALRYQIGEEVRVYTFQKFKARRQENEGREDTKRITEDGDLLGKIDFGEFDNLCRDFGQFEDSILPLQEDGQGLYEDSESEDSSAVRCNDDLDENITY